MRLVEDMSGGNRDCGSMLSFLSNGVRLFGLLRQRGMSSKHYLCVGFLEKNIYGSGTTVNSSCI